MNNKYAINGLVDIDAIININATVDSSYDHRVEIIMDEEKSALKAIMIMQKIINLHAEHKILGFFPQNNLLGGALNLFMDQYEAKILALTTPGDIARHGAVALVHVDRANEHAPIRAIVEFRNRDHALLFKLTHG